MVQKVTSPVYTAKGVILLSVLFVFFFFFFSPLFLFIEKEPLQGKPWPSSSDMSWYWGMCSYCSAKDILLFVPFHDIPMLHCGDPDVVSSVSRTTFCQF